MHCYSNRLTYQQGSCTAKRPTPSAHMSVKRYQFAGLQRQAGVRKSPREGLTEELGLVKTVGQEHHAFKPCRL